jgi:heme/copper-type cytochrome/quinol oxidase subunit 2
VTKATKNKGNKNKVTKSKVTKILWIVCPIILVCLAAWLIVAYGTSPATPPPSGNSSGPADRVDVVYFHRTQRCHTCLYAEEQTRYTLETYFKDELASGKVTFQSINVQDEANTDIVEKYNNASYLTLCINTVRDGTDHIEEVTDIWLVIGNDEAFVEIVKSKVEKSLSGEV